MIESDPVQPDFEVKDLQTDERLGEFRFKRRQRVLKGLEKDSVQSGRANTMATYYDKARDLITSPKLEKPSILKVNRKNFAPSMAILP